MSPASIGGEDIFHLVNVFRQFSEAKRSENRKPPAMRVSDKSYTKKLKTLPKYGTIKLFRLIATKKGRDFNGK